MRRIIAFDRVTADGYFAAADGGLGWVVPEPALDRAAADRLEAGGTILFGRRTYEMFESFWPSALDDAGRPREMRAMAEWIDAAEKLVFSRTRTDFAWRNTRLLGEFDAAKVEEVRRGPGRNIMVFGSGTIVSLLAENSLIDEYQLVVSPILLGGGRSLVSGVAKSLSLELLEATSYPSGNVMLRYVPAL